MAWDWLRVGGITLLAVGISGFLTSYFVINYIQLASVFAGWIFVSLVMILASSPGQSVLNIDALVKSYKLLVWQVLEEFDLHNESPYFLPSSISNTPSMYIPVTENPHFSRLPRRLFTYGDSQGVRIEVLGTHVLSEVGDVGEGLSGAESSLSSILSNYLGLARGVEVADVGGEVIDVRINGVNKAFMGSEPPSVNIYTQVVGPILAEALNTVVKLVSMEGGGSSLFMRFRVV